MAGSSTKSDPKGMTADGDTCIRCSANNKACIWPPKRGAACVGCREAKKKCQLAPDDANTRKAAKREPAAPRKKREDPPLRKRGFKKKKSLYPTTTPAFGILRQATPPESPPAESNNNKAVVLVKPLLPRTAAPPPPRPLKRKRLEEGGRSQPTTHTPSAYSDRSRVTQRQNTAFVEIQGNQGSSSRTHVPLLSGDLPPALETRLLNIEDMQITLNQRLTSTLGAVDRIEELLLAWMASQNEDRYGGYGGDDDEDRRDEE
jgi:hypothetical protein